MKSFILELTEDEAEQLKAMAVAHGNKFKPFAEYLLRLQLGTVQASTAQPVAIPDKENTKEYVEEVLRRFQYAMNELQGIKNL